MKVRNIPALVTGASSGIGRAIALELGRRGCSVALLARRREALESVGREVTQLGGRPFVFKVDVTDPGSLGSAVSDAVALLGGLRLAVVNAGVGVHGAADALDPGALRRAFEVNILGAIATVRCCLPQLRAGGPSALVAVSSLSGLIPYRGGGAYGATKAALIQYLRCLRLEQAGTGVEVGWLCPGAVQTPFIVDGVPVAKTPRLARWLLPVLPAERVATALIRLVERGGGQRVIPWSAAFFASFARLLPRLAERVELLTGAGEA